MAPESPSRWACGCATPAVVVGGLPLLRLPIWRMRRPEDSCSYANAAQAEKDLSWARRYLLKHSAFMNPISSLRSARQSEAHRCEPCHAAEEGPRAHARAERCRVFVFLFIEISLHAFRSVSRQQGSDEVEHRPCLSVCVCVIVQGKSNRPPPPKKHYNMCAHA